MDEVFHVKIQSQEWNYQFNVCHFLDIKLKFAQLDFISDYKNVQDGNS